MTNDDFEIALINSNENNFLLQDFANELAKEVIGDILTTPFNHCDTNHDVLFDYSSDLQDKHDSYKADDTDIFAEVKAIETGITLLTVDIEKYYHKVVSSSTLRLEAHAGFFRLVIKGIFDPYVLLPFDKKLIS